MTGLASGIDPKFVDQLVEMERTPIKSAQKRRELISNEKKEFDKLNTYLTELDSALNSVKSYTDFYKMKVESSHPDILDGIVQSFALPGTYEFEVRGLARSEKELAYGFPDRDETPVGFGYMEIEREDMEPMEVVIEPGATLADVAKQINEAEAGVKAIVINTKYQPDPYRLLVISEKSGKETRVNIDEDTTFLEFKEQVTGRNLDVLFEDVPITDEDNTLEELIDGVVLTAHRSEPGTRIQLNIVQDIDKTMEAIKAFVDKYNQVTKFINEQVQLNPETKRAGVLAADGSVRTIQRSLQTALGGTLGSARKYSSLSEIGINSNPKTGELSMDESKVRKALSEDYDAVARLFVRNKDGTGIAHRLAERIKILRDPGAGVLKSRTRALEGIIKQQDEQISRKEQLLEQKEQQIRRKFANLETTMAQLQSQGDFLKARLGAGGGMAPQGGGGGGGGG